MTPRTLYITEHDKKRLMELAGVATEFGSHARKDLESLVTELEQAVNRARELDTVLASERERSTQLAKRATEAEHLADQSNRRLEDMARKLAEIAGLASQLGQSAR